MYDLLTVGWTARSGQGSSDQSPTPSPLCAHSDRGPCKRRSAQFGIVASGKRQWVWLDQPAQVPVTKILVDYNKNFILNS